SQPTIPSRTPTNSATPTRGAVSAPAATQTAMTRTPPHARWKASASDFTGTRTADLLAVSDQTVERTVATVNALRASMHGLPGDPLRGRRRCGDHHAEPPRPAQRVHRNDDAGAARRLQRRR